jgi:ParB/RepB/Spo0J family partition protein
MSISDSGSSIHFVRFSKWVKEHKKDTIDSQELKAYLKEIQKADKDLNYEELITFAGSPKAKNNQAWNFVYSAIDWDTIREKEEQANVVPLFEENLDAIRNQIKHFGYQIEESKKMRTLKSTEARDISKKLSDIRMMAVSVAGEAIDEASQAEEQNVILKLDEIIEPAEPLRKDLVLKYEGFQESVAADQLVPIIVRPLGAKYEIVIGHRRYAALKATGRTEIKAIVRRNLTDVQADKMRWQENIHRSDLTPMEIAKGLENLMVKYHFNQKGCADFLGKPEKWVSDHLIVYHDSQLRPIVENNPKSLSAAVEIKHAEKELYQFQKKALIERTEQKHLSAKQVREKAFEMIRSNNEPTKTPKCFFCGGNIAKDPNDPRRKKLFKGHYAAMHESCEEKYYHEHDLTLESQSNR